MPQQVSFVERLSLSQRVPYRRFHCIVNMWVKLCCSTSLKVSLTPAGRATQKVHCQASFNFASKTQHFHFALSIAYTANYRTLPIIGNAQRARSMSNLRPVCSEIYGGRLRRFFGPCLHSVSSLLQVSLPQN